MKKIKDFKGITLVALIITIIVLLILAVVTIAAVNEGSLFEHANNAAKKYTTAAEEENSIISRYMSKINGGPEIKFTIGALASREIGYNAEKKAFVIPVSEFNDLIGANIADLRDYTLRTDEDSYLLFANMSNFEIIDGGTEAMMFVFAVAEVPDEEIVDTFGFSISRFEGASKDDFLCGVILSLDGLDPTSTLYFSVMWMDGEETVPFTSVEEIPDEIKNYEIKLLNTRKIKDILNRYGDKQSYDW